MQTTRSASLDAPASSRSRTRRIGADDWLPPTQNTDDSPLTDLAGYKLYWGTSPGTFPNSIFLGGPGLASYLVENLTPNTYFFVITAFNDAGVESGFSNVATITFP
jgi:hypothetical protein